MAHAQLGRKPSDEFMAEVKARLDGCTVEHIEAHDDGGVVLHLSHATRGPAGWVRFSAASYQDSPVLAFGWPVEVPHYIHEEQH